MKNKICIRCKKEYTPISYRQKACGNRKIKGSCSYIINKEYNKKWYETKHKIKSYRDKRNKRQRIKYLEDKKNGKMLGRFRLRFEIFKRDNFTCQYCGRKAPDVILQVDHIIPKSKDGINYKKNLITSCWECNIGKGDILLNENK